MMNERKTRIHQPLGRVDGKLEAISWEEAYAAIAERVSDMSPLPEEVLALTDTHASNEELFLLQKLLKDIFSADNTFCPLPKWEQIESEFFINTLITTDKTPNRAGAIALKIKGDATSAKLKKAIEAELKVVFVLGNPFEAEAEVLEKIKKAQLVVHLGTFHNSWSEIADVVLPGQYYSEKEGTFTNKDQRVQATEVAVQALRRTRPEWRILADLSSALGHESSYGSSADVFNAMTKQAEAFFGLSYDEICVFGKELTKKTKDSGMKVVKAQT
jgi:predicted molibdopterin-dependent oxidoreductase YjgC